MLVVNLYVSYRNLISTDRKEASSEIFITSIQPSQICLFCLILISNEEGAQNSFVSTLHIYFKHNKLCMLIAV